MNMKSLVLKAICAFVVLYATTATLVHGSVWHIRDSWGLSLFVAGQRAVTFTVGQVWFGGFEYGLWIEHQDGESLVFADKIGEDKYFGPYQQNSLITIRPGQIWFDGFKWGFQVLRENDAVGDRTTYSLVEQVGTDPYYGPYYRLIELYKRWDRRGPVLPSTPQPNLPQTQG